VTKPIERCIARVILLGFTIEVVMTRLVSTAIEAGEREWGEHHE
jgi:hypothetical protein